MATKRAPLPPPLPTTASSPSVSSPPWRTLRGAPSLRCSLPFLFPSMGVQSAPAISHDGSASCVRSDRARAAVKCKSRSDGRAPFRDERCHLKGASVVFNVQRYRMVLTPCLRRAPERRSRSREDFLKDKNDRCLRGYHRCV